MGLCDVKSNGTGSARHRHHGIHARRRGGSSFGRRPRKRILHRQRDNIILGRGLVRLVFERIFRMSAGSTRGRRQERFMPPTTYNQKTFQPISGHLGTRDRFPHIWEAPFLARMDFDHVGRTPPQIFLGPAHIRVQIAGSAGIWFRFYHLGSIVRFRSRTRQ